VNERAVFDFYEFKPGMWDFYRCQRCNGIFTYEQEQVKLLEMRLFGDATMYIHCRSHKYGPTIPLWWEWLRPNVLKYTIKLFLARGLAPIARKRSPFLLPYIGVLVSNVTTR
jgi:hypothetical protein